MRYGFVLDQRKCIGCHACTVACKTENNVPVGSFRTWVKYVEKGDYPATRRHFGVMRCNHCENAPCVKICPVNALHTRPDGIVDLDGDKCIGCQSCMHACPYDAIYINPDRGVAEKCHYCAHRVERGLEPACVVVCPVQAIVPGDLDNPNAQISQLVALLPTQVRKPEQGTRPESFLLRRGSRRDLAGRRQHGYSRVVLMGGGAGGNPATAHGSFAAAIHARSLQRAASRAVGLAHLGVLVDEIDFRGRGDGRGTGIAESRKHAAGERNSVARGYRW